MINAISNAIGMRGGSGDPDILDYSARVSTAGGTLSASDKTILTTFKNTLNTAGIWSKIKDCNVFMGGFAGTFVKLKYADASYKSMINTAFVSGDYGESTALTSTTAATKKADTQIIPGNYGLSKNNISLGYFSLDNIASDTSYAMVDNRVSGAFGFDLQKATIYMNATPVKAFDMARQRVGEPRFMYFSSNGFINWGIDFLSIYPQPAAVAVNDLLFDTTVSLWGGRNGGSNVFGSGRYAFYWIGEYLTYAQLKILHRAVRDLCIAKGRLTEVAQAIYFGDSVTFGQGASAYTNRYSYLLSTSWALQEANLGLSGSRYRVSDATINGGYPRRDEIHNYNILTAGTKIVLQYGVNDINQDVSVNGDATLISDFTTKLTTQVNELIALGVPAASIQIGSINLINNGANATKQGAWRTGARNAAVATGCKYAAVGELFDSSGGTANLADTLHPNNAGHALIRDAHLAADFVS